MTEKTRQRLLEMVPGLLVWVTFAALILLSFIRPLWAIYFIIAFDVYWFLRILYMTLYMSISWKRYRRELKVDWFARLEEASEKSGKRWQGYTHLIFLPMYEEPYEVVRRTMQSLVGSTLPCERFFVILGGEARKSAHFRPLAKKIKDEFGEKFFELFITEHELADDELPGKGSNAHSMARKVQARVAELGLDEGKLIVSNFDVDSRPHRQYFAYLTYLFTTVDDPHRTSYQPVAVFNNNIWESNPIVRVVASSTTFWLFTDMSRAERLFTFSSHSMSWRALVDVGFWDKTIVTEDSRVCLQCLDRYDGDYRVMPMYIPVYMNTVEVGRFWRSIRNQYMQIRRWAWGVEHFPWMASRFFGRNGNRKIGLAARTRYLSNQTEGVYSWATAPILIFIGGYLPLWTASTVERSTVLAQNAPDVLSTLMRIGLVGLVIIAVLYSMMLPPKPAGYRWYRYPGMVLQWVLSPFTLILFGAIPATDAQTRLMLGGKWRLGFWVTEKK